MNDAHYSNQDLSYTDDDDDSMVLQNHQADVDMSYTRNYNNNSAYTNFNGIHHNGPVGQENFNYNNSTNSNTIITNSTEKIRKKPGRKPGPSCPALRKEQNRAAQRAFRDRKERHLQQLENMIKDLKSQHFLVTSAYQREIRQLKVANESLQNENYYLREVVFAFEAALSKGNHISILKDVKHELFHRHYETRAAAIKNLAAQTPVPETPTSSVTPGTPASIPATPATPPATSMASPTPSPAVAPRSPGAMSPILAVSSSPSPSTSSAPTALVTLSGNSNEESSRIHSYTSEEGIYSLNGDILYKVPPLFIPDITEDGQLAAPTTLTASLSVPRPAYRPPGTNLPKHTEYTKHPSVFDELQSSLFPPGTLESLHINMATPQEVVSDDSLFGDSLDKEEERNSTKEIDNSDMDTDLVKIEEEFFDEEFFRKVAMTLGIAKESVPNHRLIKVFRVFATASPQFDPSIDPKIYQVPHDRRIDYIPCPKMRAQMIVHQHRYNVDELFQLLIDGAICHGPPLKRDSWQLPDAFFDRFGFLLGLELERIRNKTWPPKRG
ncbi:hypothetical protein BGZ46_003678 [Entomortierella lignicola]|nr:hypothetical protein BGZ46_003678 [Entomortierella lignicola]